MNREVYVIDPGATTGVVHVNTRGEIRGFDIGDGYKGFVNWLHVRRKKLAYANVVCEDYIVRQPTKELDALYIIGMLKGLEHISPAMELVMQAPSLKAKLAEGETVRFSMLRGVIRNHPKSILTAESTSFYANSNNTRPAPSPHILDALTHLIIYAHTHYAQAWVKDIVKGLRK